MEFGDDRSRRFAANFDLALAVADVDEVGKTFSQLVAALAQSEKPWRQHVDLREWQVRERQPFTGFICPCHPNWVG